MADVPSGRKPRTGQFITPTFNYQKEYAKPVETDMAKQKAVLAYARHESLPSIKKLVEFRDDANIPPALRIQCCSLILDRAWGKPHQSIAMTEIKEDRAYNFDNLTLEEMIELEKLMKKAQPADIIDITPQETSNDQG